MNKKFSTLVAALLVSGVSYAVVDTFNSYAMTNSPVAKAAAANVTRATTVTYSLGSKPYDAIGSKWYLTDGKLQDENGKALALKNGSLVLSDEEGATTLSFSYNSDWHLQTTVGGRDYVLAFNKNEHALSLQEKDVIDESAYYHATFFATAEQQLKTVPGISSYFLAEEVSKGIQGTDALQVTSTTYGLDQSTTFTGTTISAAANVSVEVDGGSKFLQITSAGGSVAYVHVSADGSSVSVKPEKPSGQDLGSSSIVIGDDGVIKTATGKFLEYNSGFGTAGSHTTDKGLYLYKTSEAGLITTAEGLVAGTDYYLLALTDASAGSLNGGNIVTLKFGAAGSVDANGTLSGTESLQKITVIPTEGTFQLVNGYDYIVNSGSITLAEVGAATDAKFSLSPVDGAIMLDNDYLVRAKAGGALSLASSVTDENEKVYLFSKVELDAVPVKTVPTEKGEYFIANATFSVENLSEDKYIAEVKVTTETTPDVPAVGTPAKLTEGGNYYLDDETGNNLLIPTTNGKGLTNMLVSSVTEGSLAGLWKVTAAKWNTEGVATHYQFTYRANDKYALAFDVKFDKVTKTWSAVYNPEGKYNTFFVDEAGYVSFVADETVQVKADTYTNKERWALKLEGTNWSMAVYDESSEKLKVSEVKDIVVTGKDVPEQVKWLNVTAGNGTGFGVAYVVNDKKVTLEENVLTEGVTAVRGPKLTGMLGNDYSEKMFIKISGDYEYKDLSSLTGDKLKDAAKALLSDFRASDFVAIDTVLYSKLIADNTNYYYLVSAKGSDMVTTEGKDASDASYENLIDKDSKFYSLKRRVENAVFEVYHQKGATIEDPVYFKAPEVKMPVEYNEKGLIDSDGNDGYEDAAPLYVAIKNYNKKYYVGAANDYSPLFITKNNDVDFNDVNGLVNIISRNYKTDGQVYANLNDGGIGLVLPKYVSLDKPEGQYLVTGGNYNKYGEIQSFTFTNRESGRTKRAVSLKKTDKANIYAVVGTNDTIEIKSVTLTDKYVGYKNYAKEDLDNTEYVLKVVSKAGNVNDLYITEDHNKDHSLGLNADTLETASFKLIKFEGAKTDDKAYGDTVFVSQNAYSYITKDEEYAEDKNDLVVAFTYAIYNADNMEFLNVKGQGSTLENFFYCNPDLKYAGAKAADNAAVAQRFIIKEKADGTCQLIPVQHINEADKNIFTVEGKEVFEDLADSKLYAGISDNKIHEEGSIYKIADNDLFRIVEVGAPMYRTVEAAPFDTIRIYKENMDNVALFAETAKKDLLSGEHFLGMAHKADKDAKATKFSFLVDTAYVREETKKPQYLLAIDATTANKLISCDHPEDHGYDDTGVIDTVYGKFLVNLVDSASLWEASKKHNNPYMWESYPRLGFVKAKHTNDKLIIEKAAPVKADTISLAENQDRVATFAFRIVDQVSQSFKMETAGGWVKWLNGVPVVINDIDQAEVFNLEATENTPTANESINGASAFSVATIDGAVVVKGAEGKTVVITNVLGQTVANTVITSSEATIAVPAGVVVVAVEGEGAVKAIVK